MAIRGPICSSGRRRGRREAAVADDQGMGFTGGPRQPGDDRVVRTTQTRTTRIG